MAAYVSDHAASEGQGAHATPLEGPLRSLQQHASQVQRNVADNFAQLGKHVRSRVQEAAHRVAQQAQQAAEALLHESHGLEQRQRLPVLASISMTGRPAAAGGSGGAAPSPPQPVAEVAYNPLELQARLASVPVYTVANQGKEFVLVAGEDGKQLGLFFFTEKDAQALVDKMKEQNPKLAKQAQVLTVTMDRVYEYAITPRDQTGSEGVVFRFMPDMRQVQAALQLFEANGAPVPGFAGVPVFQASGLSVKGESARYTPIFFSKDDLDVAVGNAFSRRDPKAEQAARSKLEAARTELQQAKQQLSKAARGAKKDAQAVVDAAEAKVAGAARRVQDVTAGPSVEVGSLEDVIFQMETDVKGTWGDVMFIPPGALTLADAAQKEQQQQQAKTGKKGKR